MDRNQIFTQVLSVTATLSQHPTARSKLVNALSNLINILQTTTSNTGPLDAKLTEYIFVPISQVLRISRTVPVRALELCLESISILLRGGWGGALAPELSGQLLILFTFMAKPSSAESGIAGSSEELQTLALKCIAELFAEIAKTSNGRDQLTATSRIPALGEAILVILDSLTDIPSNDVKLEAANAIRSSISAISDKDALSSFLPRIVSSLTKVLTPSTGNNTNFRVLERCLDSLESLFLRLLSDKSTKDLPKANNQSSKDESKTMRSTSWLQATASQIKIALSNILRLQNHDKSEVRGALLKLCLTIVQECRTSLADSISMVIETMVSLAGRGGPEDVIEQDLKKLISNEGNITSLLQESLHSWIISLPRLMQSKDDTIRHHLIHKISITLRLLSSESTTNQTVIPNLLSTNLRDSVSAVLSDSKGISPIAETTATATSLDRELAVTKGESDAPFAPLQLRLKGQQDILISFSYLLEELSRSDTAATVAQDLVNNLDSGSQGNQLASFWICVNLIRKILEYNPSMNDFIDLGTVNPQEELLDALYSHSLSILTDRENSNYVTNWHFSALALEVVAMQAARYKAEFRAELSETLYPVLHYLGSSNPGLRSHAITCLNIIASSCSYNSASELVISNADYIVNAVGLKLSYGDLSPQAPQVLLMMMRLCGPNLLPYMDDLVGSIFGALERYHGYPGLVELLFSVLKGMVEEGVKTPQLAITNGEEESKDVQVHQQGEVEKMTSIIEAIRKMEQEVLNPPETEKITPNSFPKKPWADIDSKSKSTSSSDPDFTQQYDEDENQQQQEPPKDPPPPAPVIYSILLKITDLTQHFLTSTSPTLRTSLLSLLHTTIPALAKHETSFLPLINTLWPVLLPRLQDPEAYVIANALDIISLMCEHAGGFMRSRIDAAWGLFKSVYASAERERTSGSKVTGPVKTKMRTTRLSDLSTITSSSSSTKIGVLSSPPPSAALTTPPSSMDTNNRTPALYTSTPSTMIITSLINLFCNISRFVEIREEQFDEVLDMLDAVVGPGGLEKREAVRKALEVRNKDAVWLRVWKRRGMEGRDGGLERPDTRFVEVR